MNVSLQFKLSQQLALTPQLQQSIRLLLLPTLDLQQEIQLQIETNPMLDFTSCDEKEFDLEDEFSPSSWEYFPTTRCSSDNWDVSDLNYEQFYCTKPDLKEHLRSQLDLTPLSEVDRAIGIVIIDAVNEDGFLTQSIAELYSVLKHDFTRLKLGEVEAVQHLIQRFDPIGCAAFSLRETLLLQLEQVTEPCPDILLAKKMVQQDLEKLGQRNYRQLMKSYGITQRELTQAINVIQRLNPKPGSVIQHRLPDYIVPDLITKKINEQWQVVTNPALQPRIGINHYYASLVQRADNSIDNQFLKSNLQEARWLIKSLQDRQETILKVGQWIVDYQQEFLEYGDEAMKPMVLSDVAFALGLHESTISRATTQKYIYTPRGMFELKYFFSSHVSMTSGEACSSKVILSLIKKLVASENSQKPFSDHKLAELINEKGIQVARRTIAKYRESLGIAPSHERKELRADSCLSE